MSERTLERARDELSNLTIYLWCFAGLFAFWTGMLGLIFRVVGWAL